MRICEQNGIKVYPVHVDGHWYIRVDINGNLKKMYDESIGSGLTLESPKFNAKGKNWCKSIEKTIIFWAEKALKLKED